MVNDDEQQVNCNGIEKVMEKEKREHTISYCHSQGKLYSRSNTKLAEINAPIIIPRRLTTLLSTIDIPLS